MCKCFATTKTVALELDDITVDTHPQGHEQHIGKLFVDIILDGTSLRSITLLNYPRPHK